MSMHTPGPWAIGNTDPLLFGAKRGNGTEPIGFVYGPSFPERSEVGRRAMATARLIAAAPEMLEALQAYEAWADGVLCRDPELAALRERMRAAVAKATLAA